MKRILIIVIFVSCITGFIQSTTVSAAGTWTDVSLSAGTAPGTLYREAMTFDRQLGHAVIFGGVVGITPTNNMWAYLSSTWSAVTDFSPTTARFDTGFSYLHLAPAPWGFEVHGYLVFSGLDSGFSYLTDAGIFSPATSTWYDIYSFWNCTAPDRPDPRRGHTMVWDSGNVSGTPKIILFGGIDNTENFLDDVWFFDPATDPSNCPWSGPFQPATRPGARAYHGMCFDESRGFVVVYGGNGAGAPIYYDTWEYNPATNNWANKPCQSHPDAPGNLEMMVLSYDINHEKVIMYGGKDPTILKKSEKILINNKTWEYDPSVPIWNLTSEDVSNARYSAAMAYDQSAGALVMYGGKINYTTPVPETWEYVLYTTPTPTGTVPPIPSTGTKGKIGFLVIFSLIFLMLAFNRSKEVRVSR